VLWFDYFAVLCVFLGFSKLHAFGGLFLLIFPFSTLLGSYCTVGFFSTSSLVKNATMIMTIYSLDTLLPSSNLCHSTWWSTHAARSCILFRLKPLHTSSKVPPKCLYAKLFYIVDGNTGFCPIANIDVQVEGLRLIGFWASWLSTLSKTLCRKTSATYIYIYIYSVNMNIKHVAICAWTFNKHLKVISSLGDLYFFLSLNLCCLSFPKDFLWACVCACSWVPCPSLWKFLLLAIK
jgi:hypothetical protein